MRSSLRDDFIAVPTAPSYIEPRRKILHRLQAMGKPSRRFVRSSGDLFSKLKKLITTFLCLGEETQGTVVLG